MTGDLQEPSLKTKRHGNFWGDNRFTRICDLDIEDSLASDLLETATRPEGRNKPGCVSDSNGTDTVPCVHTR